MIMIKAIIRQEKTNQIMTELNNSRFSAVTKIDVLGRRGVQRSVRRKDAFYDDSYNETLIMVVKDEDQEDVIRIIIRINETVEKGMAIKAPGPETLIITKCL